MKPDNILGKPGKEGVTYEMEHNDVLYAIKTFKDTKSPTKIEMEASMQKKAAQAGVAPKVVSFNLRSNPKKYIVMQKVAQRLVDFYKSTSQDTLLSKHQEQLIDCMERLDRANVLHNDGNMLNVMLDEGENIKMIDYGFSKPISHAQRKKYTNINGALTLSMLVRSMRHHGIYAGDDILSYVQASKQKP